MWSSTAFLTRAGAVGKRHASLLSVGARAHLTSSFFRTSSFQPRYLIKISSVIYIESRQSFLDKYVVETS
ncbi:hypothetical protein HMPREF0083_00809 [Aneurinibacillus aneurinilyticus ATCC 12856]|uniref:Uncharacterized protein n=1 Tax=Aneurinibacillus aneurinilyticus ATCC 12856 TaxID=649747 RepID=U1YJY8_ANEAE|nr:hypothetical protein HMPREF0083_00809 [Aneurinibacillus aneurinilyticus ATCC 12856]